MLNVPKPLAALVLAHATSLSGNVILTVAVPWLVLTTTGSATLAATAVFAGVGGAALGGLAAGVGRPILKLRADRGVDARRGPRDRATQPPREELFGPRGRLVERK